MTNKEAINCIEDMANDLQIFPDSKQGQALLMGVKALEQKPKTGHWIEHNVKCYECSECNNTKSLYTGYKTDYCPNCGAKMEK